MSPIANGTATPAGAPPRAAEALPASEAIAYLEQYGRGDGLSLAELMDSRKNGGLTYNDFLMLPGKIDFPVGICYFWLVGRSDRAGLRLSYRTQSLTNPLRRLPRSRSRPALPATLSSTPPSSRPPWTRSPRTG